VGLAYRLLHKDSEALTAFERVLSLNPQRVDALAQIVAIYRAQGQLEQAFERARTQLTAAPDNPFLYNLLGTLAMAQKRQQQAEAAFQKAIEINENLLISYLNLGNLYAHQQAYDRAMQQYEAVIASNPNLLPPYMLLGVIYDLQDDHQKANQQYKKILTMNPRFAPAANNLAWNYAEHGGNIDVALSLAQTAKEELPQAPSVSDTLGWIYYKKHVYLKAIGLLQESAAQLPDNPMVQYHLGMAYYKHGEIDHAKAHLQRALQLSQTFQGAQEAQDVLAALQ
jgi:tetratricopeptide (TPR) repeat protein